MPTTQNYHAYNAGEHIELHVNAHVSTLPDRLLQFELFF